MLIKSLVAPKIYPCLLFEFNEFPTCNLVAPSLSFDLILKVSFVPFFTTNLWLSVPQPLPSASIPIINGFTENTAVSLPVLKVPVVIAALNLSPVANGAVTRKVLVAFELEDVVISMKSPRFKLEYGVPDAAVNK